MENRIVAPFTVEQVANLQHFQMNGTMHPFTCKQMDDGKHAALAVLVPTVRGWICPFCDYTQNWTHAWMADAPRHPPQDPVFLYLASALKKFAPDLAQALVQRWERAKEEDRKNLEEFLTVLRGN